MKRSADDKEVCQRYGIWNNINTVNPKLFDLKI